MLRGMWLDALVGGSEAWEGPWASELVRREGGGGGDGRLLNVVCVCAFLEVSSVGVQTRAGAVRVSGVWPEGVRTT